MSIRMNKEEFEKAFVGVKYQLEAEGFEVTEKNKENMRKVMMGEMTRRELIKSYKKGDQ